MLFTQSGALGGSSKFITAEAFIRCFRRFIARRGIPRRIISDNGKTFKAATRRYTKNNPSKPKCSYLGKSFGCVINPGENTENLCPKDNRYHEKCLLNISNDCYLVQSKAEDDVQNNLIKFWASIQAIIQ